jgi:hypothetical protein
LLNLLIEDYIKKKESIREEKKERKKRGRKPRQNEAVVDQALATIEMSLNKLLNEKEQQGKKVGRKKGFEKF